MWDGFKAKDLMKQAVRAWNSSYAGASSSSSGTYFVEFPDEDLEESHAAIDVELMEVAQVLAEWSQNFKWQLDL